MNVFISWSGPRSQALADRLHHWLSDLIQPIDPWVSTEDLRKGTAWFTEVREQLKDMKAAIVCVTPENVHEDWLLFEAGAAAGPGHPLFTYLLDLDPSDVRGPLANFNHTRAEKDDTWRMVGAINEQLGEGVRLDTERLERQFERMWLELERTIQAVQAMSPEAPIPEGRSQKDMMAEMLDLVREQSKALLRMRQDMLPTFHYLDEASGVRVPFISIAEKGPEPCVLCGRPGGTVLASSEGSFPVCQECRGSRDRSPAT